MIWRENFIDVFLSCWLCDMCVVVCDCEELLAEHITCINQIKWFLIILCRAWPSKYLIEMVILHLSATVFVLFVLEIWSLFQSSIHICVILKHWIKRAHSFPSECRNKRHKRFSGGQKQSYLPLCVYACVSHLYKYYI